MGRELAPKQREQSLILIHDIRCTQIVLGVETIYQYNSSGDDPSCPMIGRGALRHLATSRCAGSALPPATDGGAEMLVRESPYLECRGLLESVLDQRFELHSQCLPSQTPCGVLAPAAREALSLCREFEQFPLQDQQGLRCQL